jgi:hypothetical protein
MAASLDAFLAEFSSLSSGSWHRLGSPGGGFAFDPGSD